MDGDEKMFSKNRVKVDFERNYGLILEDIIRSLLDGGIFGPVINPIVLPTGI